MTSADPKLLRELEDYWIHGRHPSGQLIAAEARDVLQGECCVWDLGTGELLWRPRAHSIAWSDDGTTVALLVGQDGEDLELRSWPERELLSRCVVRPWACCNAHVALSPRGDCAAVLWWHQSEGGVNLVGFDESGARQLEGYMTRETNLLQGPTFSPDGRLVAISEGFLWWWLPEDAEDPEVERSPGGSFRRGRLTLMELEPGAASHFDVVDEVEQGWLPPHQEWERFELLGKPRFLSNDEVLLEPEFGGPSRILIRDSGGR